MLGFILHSTAYKDENKFFCLLKVVTYPKLNS